MKDKLIFIAGCCSIESESMTFNIASKLKSITNLLPIEFIFKASFDKANRTSIKSFRGLGINKGLKILKKIKEELNLTILTDVHETSQIKKVAKIVDIIQIPAFLCRQTDLITECAKTGKTINIKKGQFISPYNVKYIIEKVTSQNNNNILITERGTCFGYNNLVVDFKSFSILKSLGYPVIFDVTHSLKTYPQLKDIPSYATAFAKAAIAYGVDGLFCEVHPNPKEALSDSTTSLELNRINNLLIQVLKIRNNL